MKKIKRDSIKDFVLAYMGSLPLGYKYDSKFRDSVKYLISQGVNKNAAPILAVGITKGYGPCHDSFSKKQYDNYIGNYKKLIRNHGQIKSAFLITSQLNNKFLDRDLKKVGQEFKKLENLLKGLI